MVNAERAHELTLQVATILTESQDDPDHQAKQFGLDPDIIFNIFDAINEASPTREVAIAYACYLGVMIGREQ